MRKYFFWFIAFCCVYYTFRLTSENWNAGTSVQPAAASADWHDSRRQRRSIALYLGEKSAELSNKPSRNSAAPLYVSAETGQRTSIELQESVELKVEADSKDFAPLLKASEALDSALQQGHITRVCLTDSKTHKTSAYTTSTEFNPAIDTRVHAAELLSSRCNGTGWLCETLSNLRKSLLQDVAAELQKECKRHPDSLALKLDWAVASMQAGEGIKPQLNSLSSIAQTRQHEPRAQTAARVAAVLSNVDHAGTIDQTQANADVYFLRQKLPDDWYSKQLQIRLFQQAGNVTAANKISSECFSDALHQSRSPIAVLGIMLAAIVGIAVFLTSNHPSPRMQEEVFVKRAGFPKFRLVLTAVLSVVSALMLYWMFFAYERSASHSMGIATAVLAYESPVREMLQEAILYIIAFVPFLFWAYVCLGWRHDINFAEFTHFRLNTLNYSWSRLVGTGLGLTAMDSALTAVMLTLCSLVVLPQSSPSSWFGIVFSSHSVGAIMEAFIVLVVLAPIIEEAMFRGLFYGGLRAHGCPIVPAVTVTALIFALVHGEFDIPSMTVRAGIGVLAALALERTKSTVPGMVAHAIHNFICGVLYMV